MYHFVTEITHEERIQRVLVTVLPTGAAGSLQQVVDSIYDHVAAENRNLPIIIRLPVKYSRDREKVEDILFARKSKLKTGRRYEDVHEFSPEHNSVLRRLRISPVHVLFSDNYEYCLSANVNPFCDEQFDVRDLSFVETMLANIQTQELDTLVGLGRCMYPPLPNGAYIAPSGRLVRSYIRAGNLQNSRHALDGLFFWLLPFLSDCVGVVSDTWTISSITQAISRRLAVYLEGIREPIPVEMLPAYHAKSVAFGMEASEVILGLLNRLGTEESGRVLVLLSATSSGSLHKHLQTPLRHRGIGERDVHFVTLFNLSKTSEIPALRDYSDLEDFSPIDEDDVKFTVEIDGLNHVPKPNKATETMIEKDFVKALAKRLSPYQNTGFVKIHYTDNEAAVNPRHHMIWLNVTALLKSKAFLRRLYKIVDSLTPPPELIIHPDFDAAQKLANLVAQRLKKNGTDCIVKPHDNLDLNMGPEETNSIIKARLSSIGKDGSVLFVDDAFVTGQRVHTYQLHARDLMFDGVFHYLTAISRPETPLYWDRMKRSFVYGRSGATQLNSFNCVETIYLPNWGYDDCSWCAETSGYHEVDEVERKSFRDLELQSELGLAKADELFHAPEGTPPFLLKKDSIYEANGIPPAAHLFLLIASAIQALRAGHKTKRPELGSDNVLIKTVLSEANISAYYSDPILAASLLRASKAKELIYPDSKKNHKVLEFYRARLANPSSKNLLFELKISQHQKKIIKGSL